MGADVRTVNFLSLHLRQYQKMTRHSIGSTAKGFKIGVTKWFRENTDIEKVLQRKKNQLHFKH